MRWKGGLRRRGVGEVEKHDALGRIGRIMFCVATERSNFERLAERGL
jgi:hypothetical protein